MNEDEVRLLDSLAEQIRIRFNLSEEAVRIPYNHPGRRIVRLVHKPTGKRIAIAISIVVER